jgi:hypothetical protein
LKKVKPASGKPAKVPEAETSSEVEELEPVKPKPAKLTPAEVEELEPPMPKPA